MPQRRALWWIIAILLACAPAALAKLSADQLLVVANRNIPESIDLAVHYARARGVPPAQVLSLDMPRLEYIGADVYEKQIADPVREALRKPENAGVRCVVLMYGVPLHVAGIEISQEDRDEVSRLRAVLVQLDRDTVRIADQAEETLRGLGAEPPKAEGTGAAGALRRLDISARLFLKLVTAETDKDRRARTAESWRAIQLKLVEAATGALGVQSPASAPAYDMPSNATAQQWANTPRDPDARKRLREFFARKNGAFGLYQLVERQVEWIGGEETDSSVDSELSLALLPDYPRFRWQPNLLNVHQNPDAARPRVMMVARIDGPNIDVARRLIDDAISVEKTGLSGAIVFDSRGIAEPPNGGSPGEYGWYDQRIRIVAERLKSKPGLTVIADDREQVLLPRTAKDVALYCGWYSLQNYIPGCTFAKGAVGFHVASLELTSMRKPLSKEWVPNLLKDGVDGTLGAVSEPYLHAFPRPDEFFPILLTGKWTLAETYWMTLPNASWKLALVGDPLYNPYSAAPGLKMEDLPESLRADLQKFEAAGRIDR